LHVALHGTLTLPTAPLAHMTVLKCLAEQPLAVVIDIGELCSRINIAVPMFLAMRRQARRQPAVPLFVMASRSSMGSALRSALTRYLPTCLTVDEAREMAARLPSAGFWRHTRLSPNPFAPHIARNLVAEACAEWRVSALMHPARTVVSELVSNAVEHARTDIDLTVTLRGRYLCAAVCDGSPVMPDLVEPVPSDPRAPLDLRGYGLRMVANLAHSWGAEATTNGKVVWATLCAESTGTKQSA
jgi:anti-sigma regulatory factor (Ser/Thr protein kinase)